MKTKLTVIILNFNTKELTIRAVRSLLLGKFQDLKVVVVDNNSKDGSSQVLKKEFGKDIRFELIGRDVNDGYAAGNNVALIKVSTPYAMLLNSDAYIDGESNLGLALEYMDQHKEVGILTPRLELSRGHIDPASHRGFPTPWSAFTYFSGLEKISKIFPFFGGYHQTWKDLNLVHEVDAVSGAAMFVRTQAMKEVGLLDEQFFMYGEDLDWCFRFKEKDWKVVYFPEILVHHDKHASGLKKTKIAGYSEATNEIQLNSRRAFYEAMRLFYKKNYANAYPAWIRHLMFTGIELVRKLKGH